jgi:hypothetical protein
LGTFHGSDAALIGPGQNRSQKWKRENINPRATVMQIRALQVKFADGTVWESYKLQELNNPAGSHEEGTQGDQQDGTTPQPAPQPPPRPEPSAQPQDTP